MNSSPHDPPATNTPGTYAGDMTVVARVLDPTAAALLKSCLQAAGIPSVIADANFVQAYSLLTTAAGGVRVMVPQSYTTAAQLVIADFERGAFRLESADDDPPSVDSLRQPPEAGLRSPDAAAFLSFVLTPVFGTVVHYLNSRTLADRSLVRLAILWLVLSVLVTAATLCLALRMKWTTLSPVMASVVMSAYTVIWYMLAGSTQGRYVVSNFGRKYRQRSLAKPAVLSLAFLLLLGAFGTFLD